MCFSENTFANVVIYICVVQVVLDTKMEALSTDDDGVGEEGEGVGISSLGELAAASRLVYVHQPTQRIGEYSVQSPLLASINTVSYTHTHTHTHTCRHLNVVAVLSLLNIYIHVFSFHFLFTLCYFFLSISGDGALCT